MSDQLTEKTVKKVVGLKYNADHGLPQVILKGKGRMADEILEKGDSLLGRPHTVENSTLVDELYKLPVDTAIHSNLFELVAAVLVHVYSVEEKMGRDHGSN